MNTQVTIRDIKNRFLEFCGVKNHGELSTNEQRLFWEKLNDLGWSKKTKEAQECADIDATAFLSQQEETDLIHEYRKIKNY